MTLAELEQGYQQSLEEARGAADAEALDRVRVRYVGRNGLIPAAVKQMKDVPAAERPAFGKRLHAWRGELEALLEARKADLAAPTAREPAFDCSLPGRWHGVGAAHPVTQVIEAVARIFAKLGFAVADGPDIENTFNNFTALNTAPHHPSMDAADTFWLDDDLLLRTQTSPVQIRVMTSHRPPVRISA